MTGYYLGADVREELRRYVGDVHMEIGAGMDAPTARVNRAKLHHVLAVLDALPERVLPIGYEEAEAQAAAMQEPSAAMADRIEQQAQAASYNQGDESEESDHA